MRFLPHSIQKLFAGVSFFGWSRAIAGTVRLIHLKVTQPKETQIRTESDGLVFHFRYPAQLMPSLVVFRELVEPEFALLPLILKSHSVFLDVGGGIGAYSILASRIVENPVHLFEPVPENVSTISKNISVNKLEESIVQNPVALSSKKGFGRMVKKAPLFLSELELSDHSTGNDDVEVTSLDVYCEENGLDRIDLLKIDVEGHEPHVLEGGQSLLSKDKINMMILEWNPNHEHLYEKLRSKGFEFYFFDAFNQTLVILDSLQRDDIAERQPNILNGNLFLIHHFYHKQIANNLLPH